MENELTELRVRTITKQVRSMCLRFGCVNVSITNRDELMCSAVSRRRERCAEIAWRVLLGCRSDPVLKEAVFGGYNHKKLVRRRDN